jgi:hypothetical protein
LYFSIRSSSERVTDVKLVKGYEFTKDQYVRVTDEELKALEDEAAKVIAAQLLPLRSSVVRLPAGPDRRNGGGARLSSRGGAQEPSPRAPMKASERCSECGRAFDSASPRVLQILTALGVPWTPALPAYG